MSFSFEDLLQLVGAIWIAAGVVAVYIYLRQTTYLAAFLRKNFLAHLSCNPLYWLLATLYAVFAAGKALIIGIILGPIGIWLALKATPAKYGRWMPEFPDLDANLNDDELMVVYLAGDNGRRCLRCGYFEALDSCTNCDGVVYRPLRSGLIACVQCDQVIGDWDCPNCQTHNPLVKSFVEYRPQLF